MVAAMALLAGCAQQPPQRAAGMPELPAGYLHACAVQSRPAAVAAPQVWWQGFQDATLTRLVERALLANLSIEQAQARLLVARAHDITAAAAFEPQAQAGAGRVRVGQSLRDPASLVGAASPAYRRSFFDDSLVASAAWDLDISGGLRAQQDAALADAAAAEARLQAERAQVAADVGDAYLRLRGAQSRLLLAERQEDVARRLLALSEQRVDAGAAAAREADTARAHVEGVLASMPPLRAQVQAELLRLDTLLGAAPGTFGHELSKAASLPPAPGIALVSGPADLLRTRADLRAAERRLAARHARVAYALSEYYPKLSVSALAGWNNAAGGPLFGGDALEHQFGIGLRWRLFDFGRIDAEVAAARGQEAEALAEYRAAVLQAAFEVETALVAVVQAEARTQTLGRQLERLRMARARGQEAYLDGAVSLTEVLDLDRQILAVSDQQAQSLVDSLRASVAAFKALGGGWAAPQAPASAAAPQCPPVAGEAASARGLSMSTAGLETK